MRQLSLNGFRFPLLALSLASCVPARGHPPTTAASSGARAVAGDTGLPTAGRPMEGETDADLRFVRGMIAHHEQALAMTRLVPSHSEWEDLRLLAERMDVSQRDEIALLNSWLSRRGASAPAASAHSGHDGDHPPMHGMLTPAQLERLAAANGAEFDRLFLEYMISHHEGALFMIRELFATPGAGQDPDVFRFTAEIEADQRIEITRMRQMLATTRQSGGSDSSPHNTDTSPDSH